MENEFPRIIDSDVFFGNMGFHLDGSNLDCLIEVLGEPEKVNEWDENTHYQTFTFDHALGKIHAFLFFCDPDADPPYYVGEYDVSDRGLLVELQLELIEPLHLLRYGRPLCIIESEQYKFAIFSKICLVRMISRRRFDCISFLNPDSIQKPKNSFLYQRVWPIERPIADLRILRKEDASWMDRSVGTSELAQLEQVSMPLAIAQILKKGPTKK